MPERPIASGLPTNITLDNNTIDNNGFPSAERGNTTVTFDDLTRTITIAPTTSSFSYYFEGKKYTHAGADSFQISDVEGTHVVYYDGADLAEVVNPVAGVVETIIRNKTIVSYVYWDADNSVHILLNDERHGLSMSPVTHAYLHFTRGSVYLSGLTTNDIIADGDGSSDTHAQCSVSTGFIADEDVVHSLEAIVATEGCPVYYLEGSRPNARRVAPSGFPVLTDIQAGVDTTGRLVWNEFTGGAWQLTPVTNNDFVLCHIFATNGFDEHNQIFALVGQNDYGNATQARAGASTEISNILTSFPSPELVPLATLIFQTSSSYSNTPKARIRTTDEGADYVDWRESELSPGSVPSAHGTLTGRSEPNQHPITAITDAVGDSFYVKSTFTPVLTATTPGDMSVGYTSRAGHVVQIGEFTYILASIITDPTTTSWTTASGDLRITGFPDDTTYAWTNGIANVNSNLVWGSGNTMLQSLVKTDHIVVVAGGNGQTFGARAITDVNPASTFVVAVFIPCFS